uniref:Hypothetical_protein n=1 Tax=Leishmania donovani TaxID=5661 RepID=A0A6J8F3C0_LEIDO|nr:hypothetical_protein [Leishmania donovani]
MARGNVASGNLPAQPTLILGSLLETPALQWIARLLLMPALALLLIIFLASPSQRRREQCGCVSFADLLERSTSRKADVAMCRRATGGSIAPVKGDVEGSEWDVLQGIADSEWRRIEQLVVDVHGIEDRVLRVEQLLKAKGCQEVHIAPGEWSSRKELRIHAVSLCPPRRWKRRKAARCGGTTPDSSPRPVSMSMALALVHLCTLLLGRLLIISELVPVCVSDRLQQRLRCPHSRSRLC